MDLSLKRRVQNAKAFDYRHKKFDHVRISPMTVPITEMNQFENDRNLVSPAQQSLESKLYLKTQTELQDEYHTRDHIRELKIDELNRPSTPLATQRVSKRKAENPLMSACPKAPKKRRVQESANEKSPAPAYSSAQNLPTLIPKISNEALARICQYNKNMVRKFPKKERSAKDQERRDKNTIACRMSRRLKKLENLAVEEQYKIFVQEHFEQQKRAMQAAVYLNELIQAGAQIANDEINNEFMQMTVKNLNLRGLQNCLAPESTKKAEPKDESLEKKIENFEKIQKEFIDVEEIQELGVQNKKPFTIEFLLGSPQS